MSAQFWDKSAQSYDEGIQKHDGNYHQTITEITALLDDADTVLDFGCASGEMTLDIAPHVAHIHGIDTSEKMIAFAVQKTADRPIENATFAQIDLFDERLKPASYCAIIALNVLHLAGDARKTLPRLNQLLKPDGLLISQTPCLGEKGWLLRGVLRFAHMAGLAPRVQNLSVAGLETLIKSSGFEMVESKVWDAEDAVQWIVARKRGP